MEPENGLEPTGSEKGGSWNVNSKGDGRCVRSIIDNTGETGDPEISLQ